MLSLLVLSMFDPVFVYLYCLSCSYAAPSSRRSARRKPNPSRLMTRWKRWPIPSHPHPNCNMTTGKAALPRCALLPPTQSKFLCIHQLWKTRWFPPPPLRVLLYTDWKNTHILFYKFFTVLSFFHKYLFILASRSFTSSPDLSAHPSS